MNYAHKVALLIGVITVINGTTVAAQAQSCGGRRQLPVTKAKLVQIASRVGIVDNVELAFQNFALNTIRPGNPIPENTKPFYSGEREIATDGVHRFVEPDGVLPLTVQLIPFGPEQTYVESVFYEVKAVGPGEHLPPSYSEYQILGFLDALDQSPAAQAGEDPAIIFLTTSDVMPLSFDTHLEANYKGIGLLHAIVCEPVINLNNILQLGPAKLVNPEIYGDILDPRFPGPIGPGAPGTL